MPSGSRYPRPGASIPYVLFSRPGKAGQPPFRAAEKSGNRTFVEDRGNKLSVDRDMWSELKTEAADGRGLTKAELKTIVTKHANDGKKGVLSKTERNALLRAIDDGLFATGRTADVARKVADGASLSLLDIKIANT
jgi:hypothetical protein